MYITPNLNRIKEMKKDDKIKCSCDICHGIRNHVILAVEETAGDPDYYMDINYDCIVKCCGCDKVSFYSRYEDIEAGGYDSDGNWENSVTVKRYPEINENIIEVKDFHLVPEMVSQIYNETISAIKTKSFILAGAGMRAIIEAICKDKAISGKILSARINEMLRNGYIAKDDTKKLHGIRFLGNDAVHDIKPATQRELFMALRIINHLLETIYTLSQASSVLDTTIDTYKEFKYLINAKINTPSVKNGTIISLRGLLGEKDCRRIEKNDFASFEKDFCDEITQGIIKIVKITQNKDSDGKNLYEIII